VGFSGGGSGSSAVDLISLFRLTIADLLWICRCVNFSSVHFHTNACSLMYSTRSDVRIRDAAPLN